MYEYLFAQTLAVGCQPAVGRLATANNKCLHFV